MSVSPVSIQPYISNFPVLLNWPNLPEGAGALTGTNMDVLEKEIYECARCISQDSNAISLVQLIRYLFPVWRTISGPRASKILKHLVDELITIRSNAQQKVQVCKELIEMCTEENKQLLRMSLEMKLVVVFIDAGQLSEAISLITRLQTEIKKYEDKLSLIEIQLLESRAFFASRNYTRAKVALTAARTAANSIYTPTDVQAALDMQSGCLHAQSGEFALGFSYFVEALDGYYSLGDSGAFAAVKYMMLCKIMSDGLSEIPAMLDSKHARPYADHPAILLMQGVATACAESSLSGFLDIINKNMDKMQNDPIISAHIHNLYNSLLEKNILKIVAVYSSVEIAFVAKHLSLPAEDIERKLSQMILDGKLNGIIDQGRGILRIHDDRVGDNLYTHGIDNCRRLDLIVDALAKRNSQIK